MHLQTWSSVLLCTLGPLLVNALSLDITDPASIKNASATVAKDMLSYYHDTEPGHPVGSFEEPYLWWEANAVWGSLVDYWNYTGDAQYVGLVQNALLAQVESDNGYMKPNQTNSTGNDDQAIWALAAMRAAELHFPNPSTSHSWLNLAINAFNKQAARWDEKTCGGGLSWQFFTSHQGTDHKNAISTGTFFQLAARLAKYTGNQTYADWATKSYDWTNSTGLISHDYKVFDGTVVDENCTRIDQNQWTYGAGAFLYGSAVMTNFTNTNATWKTRTEGLLSSMRVFFKTPSDTHDTSSKPEIMSEIVCEPESNCITDPYAYKGLAAQWMGETMQVAPFIADKILGYLQSSAEGAARQCSGGPNGTTCGTQWTKNEYDAKTGLGQELSALNVFLANLAANSSAPTNANTTTAAITTDANGIVTPSSTSSSTTSSKATITSGQPTATPSKPSSGSERLWTASWTLSLIIPVALLFLSL